MHSFTFFPCAICATPSWRIFAPNGPTAGKIGNRHLSHIGGRKFTWKKFRQIFHGEKQGDGRSARPNCCRGSREGPTQSHQGKISPIIFSFLFITNIFLQKLVGNVGLLFTNRSKEEVQDWFSTHIENDYARSGSVATIDYIVPEGPMDQFPHSMEVQLRQLGLPTSLKKGVFIGFNVGGFFFGFVVAYVVGVRCDLNG